MVEAQAILHSDTGMPMPIRLCIAWSEVPLRARKPLCFEIRKPPMPLLRDEPALEIAKVLVVIAEMIEPWPLPPHRREHVFQAPHAPRPR